MYIHKDSMTLMVTFVIITIDATNTIIIISIIIIIILTT